MSEKTPREGRQDGNAARRTRRKKNLSGRESSRQLPRPLLIAALVIIAGGGYLFWPRGGDVELGIGQQYSVVTADTVSHDAPRSGSVDLDDEQRDLIPEAPVADGPAASGTGNETAAPPRTTPDAPDDPPADEPTRTRPRTAPESVDDEPADTPAPPRIEPRERGPWALQLGAYGTEENADRFIRTLADRGIEAHARTANTSSGEIIYRVWVGWFDSRDQAEAYARQEKPRLGEAYPVHR
ncbi:hypothetical protein GF314_06195 [bacterium]|nr:hypothetical protein [bacterium]